MPIVGESSLQRRETIFSVTFQVMIFYQFILCLSKFFFGIGYLNCDVVVYNEAEKFAFYI